MNLDRVQLEIRPRSAGQTLTLAGRMLRHRPGLLAAALGAHAVPLALLGVLLTYKLQLAPFFVWLVLLLAGPVFSLPVIGTAGLLVFDPTVRFRQALALTLARAPVFVALFLINRVLILLALVLGIVPGLLLWRGSWFLGPIVLLERSPFGASFRRGWRFASGLQGQVVLHALHMSLVIGYLTLACASMCHFLLVRVLGLSIAAAATLPETVPHYHHLLAVLGFALAAPLCTLAWFFVYLDVRTRKEGWDLEISFRACAANLDRRLA